MLKKLLIFLIFLIPKFVAAQGAAPKEFANNFAWEVKQIDEFIERFNGDSTLIQDFIQKQSITKLSRTSLIKSLFNYERKDWNFAELNMFINQVNGKTSTVLLSFTDDKWFANVSCAVNWEGKPKTILLKLKVQRMAGQSFKWVIFDADVSSLGSGVGANAAQPVLPAPVDKNAFLNPMSHSLNFFNLDMISIDTRNISNYVVTSSQYSNDLAFFINECMSHRMKVVGVKSVTYSFFQIKGWDMEIQQFNRPAKNSGWLINKLTKLPS